ncbi:MAG: Spy/CpxP family protein refolding chaperone [Candidatus Gastranaerophilales bacterium]|nr:Spy/CpxP family protein refolding chaperone [Candidatus Gastranaerophilales bacterium]
MKKIILSIFVLGVLSVPAMAVCPCSDAPKAPVCGCKRPAPVCGCHKPFSQMTPDDFVKMMRDRQAFLESQLGLTAEQKAKTKVIFEKKINELTPVMTELKAKKAELRILSEQCLLTVDKNKKQALEEAVLTLKETKQSIMEKYNKEFEAVLTEEQRTEFKEMKAQKRDRHHKMKGFADCQGGGCRLKNKY